MNHNVPRSVGSLVGEATGGAAPTRAVLGRSAWRGAPRLIAALVGLLLVGCAGSTPQAKPAPAAAPSGSASAAAAAPVQAAPPQAAPAAPAPPATVRLAHAGAYSSWKLAQERGYFQEENITIEDTIFDTSTRMLPALAQGQIDTATGGIAAGFFNAMAQGIPVRTVLDIWSAVPGNQAGGLYVRKDLVDEGQIRDMRDLQGRRIGITSFGHGTEWVLHRGLQQVGLSIDDVEPVELSYPDMNIAMANKTVDGGITIEPFGTQAVGRGIAARFKPWSDMIPNDEVAVLLYSQDFAEKQTDVAKRFAKAYVRGLRDWYEIATTGKDRALVNDMTVQHTTLKDRAVVEQMPLTVANPDGVVNRDAISAAQDWFVERGYVTRKVDLDQIIDPQFADYAVAQLGRYPR
jgi:NitT/TauT family transport system substrate-binding protein